MTDFSSFTNKWRATPAGSHPSDASKINKRNRQPVSCAPCRNRKLKCDRGHPCDACTKRGDDDSCIYGKTPIASTTRRDETKTDMKAQERLRHLEELVKQMINPEQNIPTPHTPHTDDLQQPEGSLNKDVNGTSYTGSTHWATVLDQIQELQNTLAPNNSNDEYESIPSEDEKLYALFSAPQPPPLATILQRNLPPREDCNRYLSTYFNAKYITIPFIHTYQFKRQYERFWDNQLETSPIWVSMLFSLLCLADGIRRAPLLLSGTTSGSKPYSPFLAVSAQCLVLGDFSKPQPYILEALAMHCQCKYAVTLDPSHELGMIFSLLARLAYTMGYHRESSVFGNQFSVFEAEMRRRCWHLIRQFDLMVSFQSGLPSIIQPDSADTKLPSHLLDEDFDEDTVTLPTPRSDNEPTQMLYLRTKAGLMDTYCKVAQHTLTFPKQPFTAADIAELDNSITQTIESIPVVLRARPMSTSYSDPPNLTMTRSSLMFLGEKARCVLHRKYMVSGPNAAESRTKCITSCTRTISHFLDLHAELQPGGQLYSDRWMLTSFTINDFLLALMVLCLAFSLGRKKYIADGGDGERWLERDEEAGRLYAVLEKALPVCKVYGERGREARHVAQAVQVVLVKLKPGSSERQQQRQIMNEMRKIDSMNGPMVMSGVLNNGVMPNVYSPVKADTTPIDIMPLSIHGNGLMNGVGDSMLFSDQQIDITPASSYDLGASTAQLPTSSNPTEPSPTSSWDSLDGPFNNILEGPEQIDWVQFDQFLWMYGNQNEMDEEIL